MHALLFTLCKQGCYEMTIVAWRCVLKDDEPDTRKSRPLFSSSYSVLFFTASFLHLLREGYPLIALPKTIAGQHTLVLRSVQTFIFGKKLQTNFNIARTSTVLLYFSKSIWLSSNNPRNEGCGHPRPRLASGCRDYLPLAGELVGFELLVRCRCHQSTRSMVCADHIV
jgi:hypothetical protein